MNRNIIDLKSNENRLLIAFLGVTIIVIIVIIGVKFYSRVFELKCEIKLISTPYHQVVFYFNQPVIKSSFEKGFEINPFSRGEFLFRDSNREVIFIPFWPEYNTLYNISISNVRSYALTKLGSKRFNFKILPPSSLNLLEVKPSKLPISKNYITKPNGKVVRLNKPKITKGKYIDIDIGDQILAIYKDGKVLGVFDVSTGRYGMPTPLGNFKILTKERNHWSYKYKLYMPYSLKFAPGVYIHELPYWPNGYREGVGHLGKRVSHGCVRLGIGPAETVYNFADIGTFIFIHN